MQLHCSFLVYIVICKKGRRSLERLPFAILFLLDELLHEGEQVRHIDRLGDVSVHACSQRGLFVLLEGVGGNGDNRQLCQTFIRQCADLLGRFVAVHNGHLDIHENQVIITGCGLLHHFHSDGAVIGLLGDDAGLLKDGDGDFAVQLVVLNDQQALALEVRLLGLRLQIIQLLGV